ncbi:MAG: hypothetical protein IJQ82_12350 [Selenomonadaceae bacterium]|nr:hypothetical protein [Selenomonadaceae bacterium]
MKNAAKFLSALAIIIFFSSPVEASDLNFDSEKVFVKQKFVMPQRLRRPFLPPMRTPQKDYVPRQPFRPKPHFLPHFPKPTYDNRGGKRKNFGPPQSPQR